MRRFAGIGARAAPVSMCQKATDLAYALAERDWGLNSGNADGMDVGFAKGINRVDPARVNLYMPWSTYKPQNLCEGNNIITAMPAWTLEEVRKHCPWFDKCTPGVKKMHRRNMQIILGTQGESPVEFVICWTPGGEDVGGTGVGTRCAKAHNIPVFNLYFREHMKFLEDKLL